MTESERADWLDIEYLSPLKNLRKEYLSNDRIIPSSICPLCYCQVSSGFLIEHIDYHIDLYIKLCNLN